MESEPICGRTFVHFIPLADSGITPGRARIRLLYLQRYLGGYAMYCVLSEDQVLYIDFDTYPAMAFSARSVTIPRVMSLFMRQGAIFLAPAILLRRWAMVAGAAIQ